MKESHTGSEADSSSSVKEITIPKKAAFRHTFTVDKPNTLISWGFRLEKRDVKFGITQFNSNSEHTIKPLQTFLAKPEYTSGTFTFPSAGTYSLLFENASSKHSAHLWFFCKVGTGSRAIICISVGNFLTLLDA